MHALHPRNLFALFCLLLLTASAAAATPANHDALMTDGEYRKAFEAYSTTEQEAGERLDAQDFAAVQKVVQAEMAEWAEMESMEQCLCDGTRQPEPRTDVGLAAPSP